MRSEEKYICHILTTQNNGLDLEIDQCVYMSIQIICMFVYLLTNMQKK